MKLLFFITLFAITFFAESTNNQTYPFYCCLGVTVDESSNSCDDTRPCGLQGFQCSRLKIQFADHKVVHRTCIHPKDCNNATEVYKIYKGYILFNSGVNNSQPLSTEIECCDKEKCNDDRTANDNVTGDDNATANDNVTGDDNATEEDTATADDNETEHDNTTGDDTAIEDDNGNDESGTVLLKGVRFNVYFFLVLTLVHF